MNIDNSKNLESLNNLDSPIVPQRKTLALKEKINIEETFNKNTVARVDKSYCLTLL